MKAGGFKKKITKVIKLKYLNKHNLPQSLVDSLVGQPRDYGKFDWKSISITTLIDTPRLAILKQRHWDEIEMEISDMLFALMGSAAHSVLEKAKSPTRLIEGDLKQTIDGIDIVGRYDLFELDTRTLCDYKMTSVWSFILPQRESKSSYEKQLNCYAYMLGKIGEKVKALRVIALLRDWARGQAMKDRNYPQIPFVDIGVKLWTKEEQLKYIKERIRLFKEGLLLSDNDIPLCTPEERWQKETTYAVFAGENKRATKVHKTKEDAEYHASCNPNFRVEHRQGYDTRCVDYCVSKKFCKYWQEHYGEKE